MKVLAPMGIEARAFRAGAPWADVHRIGIGPRRARLAADLADPGEPVLVAGFCGALAEDLEPGDIVLASELRGPDATIACPDPALLAGVLRRGGFEVRVGPIVSSERLVVRERRRELAATGALAVDMESAWIAPSATLRVVLDTHSAELHRPLRTATGFVKAYRALRGAASLLGEWAAAVEEDIHFKLPPKENR